MNHDRILRFDWLTNIGKPIRMDSVRHTFCATTLFEGRIHKVVENVATIEEECKRDWAPMTYRSAKGAGEVLLALREYGYLSGGVLAA